ncbi:MAG: helix-turn-helix transcriptional regulator [Clostridia bacterium]|nr:helix-turn-helix transcriptional regulator [Clostridia bacterium]
MEELKVIFAQNLANLRKQMKLTQVEFAEKINYSDKAVSKWERGESIPDVSVLKGIADFFGVTIDFLVTKHELEPKQTQTTKYEKKVKTQNRALISAITVVALAVCMLTVFVCLQSALPQNIFINLQLCFVCPLPICFLVLFIFSSIWAGKKQWRITFLSAFIWSLLLTVFCIIYLATSNTYPLLFLVGVPSQIIVLMSYGIISIKPLKTKQQPTENSEKVSE